MTDKTTKVLTAAQKRPPAAGIGRKKGVPNKNTTALKDMIMAALDETGGLEYLVRQSNENPTAFLTLVGKVLPLQVKAEGSLSLQVVTGVPQA